MDLQKQSGKHPHTQHNYLEEDWYTSSLEIGPNSDRWKFFCVRSSLLHLMALRSHTLQCIVDSTSIQNSRFLLLLYKLPQTSWFKEHKFYSQFYRSAVCCRSHWAKNQVLAGLWSFRHLWQGLCFLAFGFLEAAHSPCHLAPSSIVKAWSAGWSSLTLHRLGWLHSHIAFSDSRPLLPSSVFKDPCG